MGDPVVSKPGKTWVQVVLFLLGFVTYGVGFVAWAAYGLWRIVKTEALCTSCNHAKTMISVDSPRGRKLKKDFEAEGA